MKSSRKQANWYDTFNGKGIGEWVVWQFPTSAMIMGWEESPFEKRDVYAMVVAKT